MDMLPYLRFATIVIGNLDGFGVRYVEGGLRLGGGRAHVEANVEREGEGLRGGEGEGEGEGKGKGKSSRACVLVSTVLRGRARGLESRYGGDR